MQISPVFEETYQHYLAEIGRLDYLAKAELLNVDRQEDSLIVPLYSRQYRVCSGGITDMSGASVIPAIRIILSKYILTCDSFTPAGSDPYMTFRDFKDASPLISYFTTNTNKTLEATFSGNLKELRRCCQKMGGIEQQADSFDLSFLFLALPRVPVVLNFNDKDELFPASCTVLYRESAQLFLDMECLAMTGTLLAGELIRA
jgi:hypothetical protein